ncbi:MAG: HTH-type transcriptional repressor YvoA [Herbaspirillum frisingense]|uniref:HTH-type transcriptional repressor YvoA n=1 Tax=Herbaspirillum frisingense TaxID=92645 RepID=A0A7V8FZU2_9BURK|nr:MAG: HTH-type transcriptional repressor YvoA [Herbaspirillum frisingense]
MLDQTGVDSRLPLYLQLRDQLAAQIRAQIWQPGQPIPSETELRNTYQVAIGTVRRAIETLVAEGLVERTHGKGTFVRKARFDNSLFRFFRFESADGRPLAPRSVIVSRKTISAPPRAAEVLRLKPQAKVIELLRLRTVDEQPVLAENIYLCEQRFKALAGMEPAQFGDLLYPLYERECGQIVASARETLTVETVTAAQARLLGLKENTPVVVIERIAFGSDGEPLEWRQSRGAASKFRYSAEIR